jgi:hypothetical protein
MLLILRDEDVETVGSAITAIALQHGLEPVGPEEEPRNILSLAAALLGPRVVLAPGEDFVLADGLASLDIGDAQTWGEALSAACGNEVIAIAPTASGIRVTTFDDGERDETIDVDVEASGTTRSEALAGIAPSDEAADELRKGVPALNAIELATQVVRLLDAGEDRRSSEPLVLSFHDPREDGDGGDD